jgi:AraC family transcriptional regulator of adaptative response/methylated-DNA-[protein]-cysteine methyltransferase
VFCRPGCAAKTPRPENVAFYSSVKECLVAGYRPCKRCRPLDRDGQSPAWVERARRLAEETVDRRIANADLRAEGIDPARATRYFKTHYGLTFQAYQRAHRMGLALKGVRAGATIGELADAAGYESESGFRSAFTSVFGAAPTRISADAEAPLRARWLETPLGPMLAVASATELHLLEFADRRALPAELEALRREVGGSVVPGSTPILDGVAEWLPRYFAGVPIESPVPLRIRGSELERRVWEALTRIPIGVTRTYGELAAEIGMAGAARAVGGACGRNRVAILIPCHRVVGADGALTGYGGGLWRKRWLLDHERRHWTHGGDDAGELPLPA